MSITIFVSYATKDAAKFHLKWFTEQLLNKTEIDEVLYWEEDAHESIIEYMGVNITKCDVFLLFCSQNASRPSI